MFSYVPTPPLTSSACTAVVLRPPRQQQRHRPPVAPERYWLLRTSPMNTYKSGFASKLAPLIPYPFFPSPPLPSPSFSPLAGVVQHARPQPRGQQLQLLQLHPRDWHGLRVDVRPVRDQAGG